MATKLTARNRPGKPGDRNGDDHWQQAGNSCDLSSDEILELLGDEYTRRVLQAVIGEAKSGSEIVEDASVSKATAYRRLETLREAGLVTASTVLDPDGHHHEQFLAVVEEITLDVEGGEISAEVRCK